MTPRLLVFDLDGTLIDSSKDLCNSVNATLSHFQQPTLPDATIASYIGDGVHALVRRSLAHSHPEDPHDDAFIEAAVAWFIRYYRVHKLDFTYVYPGVMESLEAIRSRHPQLSNGSPHQQARRPQPSHLQALRHRQVLFRDLRRQLIRHQEARPGRPPQADLGGRRQAPAETVLIGDSHVDVETARAAGTRVLGCTFGLSPQTLAAAKPDLSVDHAADWPAALGL